MLLGSLPMDIREWLQEIADREPPGGQDDRSLADCFQQWRTGEVVRRPRQPHSTLTSAGASDPPRRRSRVTQSRRYALQDDARVRRDEAAHQKYQTLEDNSPVVLSVPRDKYERRARHKTRPDYYEPKARQQKKDSDSVPSKEPHCRHSAKRRRGDGAHSASLLQDFQLKNTGASRRLTLKPDAHAGIFKHGRASKRTEARGSGLPDLVFNEMRFLQEPKEHQDENPTPEPASKIKQHDKKRREQEDISAYFRTLGSHVEKQLPTKQALESVPHNVRSSKRRHTTLTHNMREVRKPGEQQTDPGRTKSHQKRSLADQGDKNSTWLSSVPENRLASPPEASPNASMLQGNSLAPHQIAGSVQRATKRRRGIGKPRLENSSRNPSLIDQNCKNNTQRMKFSREQEDVHRANLQLKGRLLNHNKPVDPTTSQSLPREEMANLEEPSTPLLRVRSNRPCGETYATSDILKLRESYHRSGLNALPDRCEFIHKDEDDKENCDPSSSILTSKRLRDNFESLAESHCRDDRQVPQESLYHVRQKITTHENSQPISQKHALRSLNLLIGSMIRPSGPPNFNNGETFRDEQTWWPPIHHSTQAYEEEEMLDDLPIDLPPPFSDVHRYLNDEQAEKMVFGRKPVPVSGEHGIYSQQAGLSRTLYERSQSRTRFDVGDFRRGRLPPRGTYNDEIVFGEHSIEFEDDATAFPPDFWPAQKLYF